MLEWVCPRCDRDVDPGCDVCPFCGASPGEKPRQKPAGRYSEARRVLDRGFRIFLGLGVSLVVAYFLLYLYAYYTGRDALADWLVGWLRIR